MAAINKAAFAAAAALAASLAAVAEDARGLLERMEHVLVTRNYQGTFVHEHGGQTETMKIVHRAENGDFAERVVSLDGSRREACSAMASCALIFPTSAWCWWRAVRRAVCCFRGWPGWTVRLGRFIT